MENSAELLKYRLDGIETHFFGNGYEELPHNPDTIKFTIETVISNWRAATQKALMKEELI